MSAECRQVKCDGNLNFNFGCLNCFLFLGFWVSYNFSPGSMNYRSGSTYWGAIISRYSTMKATLIAFACTFFEVFNVPVFWPILVMYFIILTCLTMKRQIMVGFVGLCGICAVAKHCCWESTDAPLTNLFTLTYSGLKEAISTLWGINVCLRLH